ncbi:helix-turn-helix domain-containing protein [Kitasatospora purpeofusca]|uniref:helix-turn-helix domain-containing protein n=1 Tax=Kitasatospora purpeofusca TaxID=67352 RepID=UPI0035D9A4FB
MHTDEPPRPPEHPDGQRADGPHGSGRAGRAGRHDNLLGEYLRARREHLAPDLVGIPRVGHRRVPGLRREEVAVLAGVSTDYYTRLEQGRERSPSPQLLNAVARALRLDEHAAAHLLRLAAPRLAPRPRRRAPERPSPALQQLLDSLDTPAVVVGPAFDVLALNGLAATLYTAFDPVDNLVRMTFLDPAARTFHRDWDRAAHDAVAALRAAAGRDPEDRRLIEVVGELSLRSPEFGRLWARHEVHGKTGGSKLLHHPRIGDLDLHYETLTVNSAPGQQLVVYQARPGSPSAEGLLLLRALTP